MEEKNASKKGPPEVIEPSREIQDGLVDRRSFLNRAGLAVGAAGMLGGLASSVRAQQVSNSERVPNPAAKLQPDRFDYLPSIDRPVIKWPNNARVAFWFAPNVEWYEYTPLNRPTQPQIDSYSYRDYGNRIGFWRMLDILDKYNIRACVCLNGATLEHCPEVKDAMVARNWDYMAHGFYNTRPITAYSIDEERAYWADMIATVKKLTGKQIKGRLGAGGGNTVNTTDLMAENGLLYHTDWLMDDQPVPLKVKNGAKFIHVPYSYQINDAIVTGQHRDAEYFGQMIKDQFDVLYEEGAQSGKVMCLSVHPYWIGKAHRAKYLDAALKYIKSHDQVWYTTADDIAEYYIKNYYDQVVAFIAQQKQKGLV
jgi:peptidoglycan/xylan/chitin deacetylase (PgdA/CDA1 family)